MKQFLRFCRVSDEHSHPCDLPAASGSFGSDCHRDGTCSGSDLMISHSKCGVAVFLLHQFSLFSHSKTAKLGPKHREALREARSDASASTRRSRVAPLTEMLSDLDDNNTSTPHISESVPLIESRDTCDDFLF